MNLTSLQQRKLYQFKEEISLLERQVEKHSFLFVVRLAWIASMLCLISECLIAMLFDKTPLPASINEYGVSRILTNFFIWLFIDYLFLFKGTRSTLKTRRQELAAYESKLAKKTTA